jgi:hypothetical protein
LRSTSIQGALIKSEFIWHRLAIRWWAILCTDWAVSLLRIFPACPAMGGIGFTRNF